MAYYNDQHPVGVHSINYPVFCAGLFSCITMLIFGQALGDNDTKWIKVKDREGISIYRADVDDSDIIKVRTEVTIDASMHTIQQILDQVQQRSEWIPYLAESRILQSFSATERLEYSVFSAPWPASDRDFVYRIRLLHQHENSMSFSMISESHPLMPEQDGTVRAELIESIYTLSALGPQQTRVELIFHADPKGWLPVWIINIIQKALPFMMLKNLRARAETSD